MERTIQALGLISFAAGCAHPGTKPGDMTAAQHEAAAGASETEARSHAAQYDPDATLPNESCRQDREYGSGDKGTVCWTSDVNPTEQHREDARRHHEAAAAHRQASAALVAAEQRACSGVPEADREMSPFRHREDIVSVTKLERTEMHGRVVEEHLGGAAIVFRAVPGMTEQWLQRVVTCHEARNAVIGYTDETMQYCPLAVKGAKATVRGVSGGFAIDVRASEPAAAQEILSRATALKPAG